VSGGEPSAEDRPPEGGSVTPEHMVLEGVDAGRASAGVGAPDAQVECDGDVELSAPVEEAADKLVGVTDVHGCKGQGGSATTARVAIGATLREEGALSVSTTAAPSPFTVVGWSKVDTEERGGEGDAGGADRQREVVAPDAAVGGVDARRGGGAGAGAGVADGRPGGDTGTATGGADGRQGGAAGVGAGGAGAGGVGGGRGRAAGAATGVMDARRGGAASVKAAGAGTGGFYGERDGAAGAATDGVDAQRGGAAGAGAACAGASGVDGQRGGAAGSAPGVVDARRGGGSRRRGSWRGSKRC